MAFNMCFLMLVIISLTAITDKCDGKDNNIKTASNEGPVGHQLNGQRYKILCSLNLSDFDQLSNLCKGKDINENCNAISYTLGFQFNMCQNVMPDAKRSNETYNVCGCTDNPNAVVGDSTSWTFITVANLVTPNLIKNQSCPNGFKVLHSKV